MNFDQILELMKQDKSYQSHILHEIKDKTMIITLNREDKQNALSLLMYLKITELMNKASADDKIQLILIQGKGKSFSSGNDLQNFMKVPQEIFMDKEKRNRIVKMMGDKVLLTFVKSFIECKKPVIAMVQGNVVGVAFTILGLCDLVYATKEATFRSPLLQLALGPEGGSSYTFVNLFGRQKAFQYLVLGETIGSQELFQNNFVNQVFDDYQQMQQFVYKQVQFIAALDYQAIVQTKRLLNYSQNYDSILLKINQEESDNWAQRCADDAMIQATLQMLTKNSKKNSKVKPKL